MNPEFFALAELAIAGAQVVIYGIGVAAIHWHLWELKKYGRQRDREIDAMAARLRETNREIEERLEKVGRELEESTRRWGQLPEPPRPARLNPSN